VILPVYFLLIFHSVCSNYSGAADYLYHFRVLSTDNDLNTSAQWGKLASDILSGKWDAALQELDTLRESIDSRSLPGPALLQLHSRTWLLHWSLFVYFNAESGRTLLLETFLSPVYLNTIQTSCPWVLRYLAAAAVLSRAPAPGASPRVRNALREVIKVVQMEEYQYTDPITAFLKELYVEFDFEAAQRELGRAEHVLSDDFFLGEFAADFLDNARYLISEAYCRTHQKIDIRCVSLLSFFPSSHTVAGTSRSG
jgi:translation initiation factor 3 subunit E